MPETFEFTSNHLAITQWSDNDFVTGYEYLPYDNLRKSKITLSSEGDNKILFTYYRTQEDEGKYSGYYNGGSESFRETLSRYLDREEE